MVTPPPFILFTGRGREEVAIEALNSGADFYMQKGGDVQTLFAVLEHKLKEAIRRSRAERALVRNEVKFRSFMNASLDAFILLDQEGRVEEWSRGAETLFGVPREEVLGMYHWDLLERYLGEERRRTYSRDKMREMILGAMRTGEATFMGRHKGIHLHLPDGTVRVVEQMVFPFPADGGYRLGSVTRDITESSRAEEDLLRRSKMLSIVNGMIIAANRADDLQQLFTTVLDDSMRALGLEQGGIYLLDKDGQSVRLVHSRDLPHQLRTDRYTPVPGSVIYNSIFKEAVPLFTDDFERMAPEIAGPTGIRSVAILPLVSRGVVIGTLNLASYQKHAFSDDHRRTLVTIGRELGIAIGRMLAEEEAHKDMSNFQALFDSIDDLVYIADTRGFVLEVNAAFVKQTGLAREDVLGTNVLLLYPTERWDEALEVQQDMLARTVFSYSIPFLRKDGTELPVETKVTYGWWNDQQVIFALSRNMTERRRSERIIDQANKKLGLLTEVTRHDMRNQLSVLSGYLHLLGQTEDTLKCRDLSRKMERSIQTLRDQLEFTKKYQDIGSQEPVWQDLHALVSRAREQLDLGGLQVEEENTHMLVLADPLLEKVVFNMVDNVLRHGSGATVLRVRMEEEDGHAILTFQDDGAGIGGTARKHLFERGYGKNTGFGLFLSREVLGMTDMSIQESSTDGEGARFDITIPRSNVRPVPPAS